MATNENTNQCSHTVKDDAGTKVFCPFCFVVKGAQRARKNRGEFFTHLFNAQIEMLQAFRSLIDRQIASLEERKGSCREEKKATKIEVE